MKSMISIDPGTRGCGVASWNDGKLHRAAYVHNTERKGSGPRECAEMAWALHRWIDWEVDVLALEIPQIYQRAGGTSKGDPNLLISLFGIGAALAALLPDAEVIYGVPKSWKGTTKKPEIAKGKYIITTLVKERLAPEELAMIEWPTVLSKKAVTDADRKRDWDVADALGVGLHWLGRFERTRVYARE